MHKIKFDEVLSLGYNCEVSFRLQDRFVDIPSYIYTWAFCLDKKLFLESLSNDFNDIVFGNCYINDVGMINFEKYNMSFHCAPKYKEMLKKEGVSEDLKNEIIEDTKNKILYLAKKTLSLFSSNKKILFVIKVDETCGEYDIVLFIKELLKTLNDKVNNKQFLLVAVVKEDYFNLLNNIKTPQFEVAKVDDYAPIDDTKFGGDLGAWKKILSRYEVESIKNNTKTKYKKFKQKFKNFVKKVLVKLKIKK